MRFVMVFLLGFVLGAVGLAYFEWSVDAPNPEDVDGLDQHSHWAASNPALGIRITTGYIANELRSMPARTFAVERLGVGDWHTVDGTESAVIHPEVWAALSDQHSKPKDPITFAFDITPDRQRGSIDVAGARPDDRWHIEMVDRRP